MYFYLVLLAASVALFVSTFSFLVWARCENLMSIQRNGAMAIAGAFVSLVGFAVIAYIAGLHVLA